VPERSRLDAIPEPWHGRLTARRPRRWLVATRAAAAHNARLPADAPVLNFSPMRPQPTAPICRVLERLGMRIGYRPDAAQPTIAWDGDTWFSPRSARRLPPNAINVRCLDVSKSRVNEEWERVAGYPLAVDPLVTSGSIVVKPEENARHAGVIVEGPIERRRRGHVYQRLVDCRVGDQIVQLRAVIIGPHIALAYEKFRPYPNWFTGTQKTIPRKPDELFSTTEQQTLLGFAAAMGLDYGELDVLRDQHSGLIYVVDANRTPARPHQLAPEDQASVYDIQAEAFRELLRRWAQPQASP
jgi:hypothetical protein